MGSSCDCRFWMSYKCCCVALFIVVILLHSSCKRARAVCFAKALCFAAKSSNSFCFSSNCLSRSASLPTTTGTTRSDSDDVVVVITAVVTTVEDSVDVDPDVDILEPLRKG